MTHTSRQLRANARAMRRAPTGAERALWRLLRGRRFAGYKFRRQTPLGPFIVDFLLLHGSPSFCLPVGSRNITVDIYDI
jgi:very-short-patch-repair endonuclease